MPDVVLPVLDEANALPWVLGRIPVGFTPIVVDNGSSDGSGDVAAALGAIVWRIAEVPVPYRPRAALASLQLIEAVA
jgi:glycosyltransferase involved in cell wall biosynthesis